MTERAKRAAAVLRQHGWLLDEDEGVVCVECPRCGDTVPVEHRYCCRCGERSPGSISPESLATIEAAIVAALGE